MSDGGIFSAASSLVGYVYQCEFALYRALDRDESADRIFIETLDDVVIEGIDNSYELLQLKHHDPAKAKSFTDKSPDLWKTIRIWSTLVADGTVDATKTKFYLLTTAKPSASASLVSLLAPKDYDISSRRISEATKVLLAIADEMVADGGEDALKNCGPFLALPPAERNALVSNMFIVPGVELIEDLRVGLQKRLRMAGATRDNMLPFSQYLLGWWYWAVVEQLRSKTPAAITKDQLEQQIADLVTRFAVSELPSFSDMMEPDGETTKDLKTRLFVRQLQAVGHSPDRNMVAGAVVDYYRADGHIKRWMQDLRLEPAELGAFRSELHGHWLTNFGSIEPEIELCSDVEAELGKLGRRALDGSLRGCQAKLKTASHDYLRRGVMHIMANEPSIGWHPHWQDKFPKED